MNSYEVRKLFISKTCENNKIKEVSTSSVSEGNKSLIVNDKIMFYLIAYYVVYREFDLNDVLISGENSYIEQVLIDNLVHNSNSTLLKSILINKLSESISRGFKVDKVCFTKSDEERVYVKSNGEFGYTKESEWVNIQGSLIDYFAKNDNSDLVNHNELSYHKPFYNEKDGAIVVSTSPMKKDCDSFNYSMIKAQMEIMNKHPIIITESIIIRIINKYTVKDDYSLLKIEFYGDTVVEEERHINNLLKLSLTTKEYDTVILNEISKQVNNNSISKVEFINKTLNSKIIVGPSFYAVDNNYDKVQIASIIEEMKDEYF